MTKIYVTTWRKGGVLQSIHTSLKKAVDATASCMGTTVLQPKYSKVGKDVLAVLPGVVIDEYETDDGDAYTHGKIYGKRVWPKAQDIELIWCGKPLTKRQRRKDKWPDQQKDRV